MKLFALLVVTAALYASPSPGPSLDIDGQLLVSNFIGVSVVPTGLSQTFQICLNDNSSGGFDDQDFNDGCATAHFGPDNALTLTYLGGLTSAQNYIGVIGQDGWVGPGVLQHVFTYVVGVETVFAGYVNGGQGPIYQSGPQGNNHFFAMCTACPDPELNPELNPELLATPEPSAFLITAFGLVGLAIRRRK